MLLKQILIGLIGLFFFLAGVNHYYNEKVLAGYARKRQLFKPKLTVRATGVLLMIAGVGFLFESHRLYAVVALCAFVALATILMHRFWVERDRDTRMLEAGNFAKNLVIITELLYIQWA
jgi:uncharacterized membrane protein YphA (DoxX/SURF4 family)